MDVTDGSPMEVRWKSDGSRKKEEIFFRVFLTFLGKSRDLLHKSLIDRETGDKGK